MTETIAITPALIDSWADDPNGPVALHLKQKLIPVEGEDAVIFPPTYADIGYSIDELSDGTKVAQIDSVGSQANRMEPLFKDKPLSDLVPQIDINLGNQRTVSLLDAGHRLGDALVRCSELHQEVKDAFEALSERRDAHPIAKLAPTTLVFGAWDSRGEGAKLPRLVQATVRAWDVDVLHRAAQYNPPVDYSKLGVFDEDTKTKAEGNTKSPLAQRGFVHVPAIWRDDAKKERILGGIIARGGIWRDVTVNLIALRALGGENGQALRHYVLGLALVAAGEPQDGFLRQGCFLTLDPVQSSQWSLVYRDGRRQPVAFDAHAARDYAASRAKTFGVGSSKTVAFRTDLAIKDAEDQKEKDKAKKAGKDARKTQHPAAAAD